MKIILAFNENIYQHELFLSLLRIYTVLSFQLLLRCRHHSSIRPQPLHLPVDPATSQSMTTLLLMMMRYPFKKVI